MQINGKVIEVQVDVQVAKKGGGFYPGSLLTYRDHEGKACEQAFHENAFKFKAHLKEALTLLHVGDTFKMEKEKQGDFWNVMSIVKTDGTEEVSVIPQGRVAVGASSTVSKPAGKVLGSTYETPEERAKKQVYIVRQSSISAAINMLSVNIPSKSVISTEEVLEVAKEFEKYVFSIPEVEASDVDTSGGILEMESDIPQ